MASSTKHRVSTWVVLLIRADRCIDIQCADEDRHLVLKTMSKPAGKESGPKPFAEQMSMHRSGVASIKTAQTWL